MAWGCDRACPSSVLVDLNASHLKRLPLMPLTQGTDRRNALLRVEGKLKLITLGGKKDQRGGNIGWASLEPDGRKRRLVGAWERSQGLMAHPGRSLGCRNFSGGPLKEFSPCVQVYVCVCSGRSPGEEGRC